MDFIQAWFDAEAGKLDPFVLVIEGSLGNEKINGDGYWTGFGVNPSTGQPITVNEWVDRLAPRPRPSSPSGRAPPTAASRR
jgi:hydrogenase small subunit